MTSDGAAKFSVALQIDKQAFTAELMGNRVRDAYIHDFTDNDSYMAFLGMISKSSSVSVVNSNGANVVTLGGQGTSEALTNFGDCLRNDWETTRQSNQLPFRFDQYTVPHRALKTNVPPSFAGQNNDFRAFQTRLRKGMREGPNFADHYTVITIGCGTNCAFVVVGNNATGDLLKFPLDGDDNYLTLQFQVGSSLLVAQGTETTKCRRNYYNFVNGQFELLAKLTSDDSDTCQKPIPQH